MLKEFNAFIFARGGSKGVPNKNLRKINGISLVRRSIDLALELENVSKVFLSTDSDLIADEGNIKDVEIIKRPLELADDNSPELSAWKHAIYNVESRFGKFDKFVSIPPTSPLRKVEDVQNIMNLLNSNFELTLGVTESHRNPWFNMVKFSEKNSVKKIFNNSSFSRRQDAPQVFDITTVAYAGFTEYILSANNILDGLIGGVKIPVERSIDIDTKMDLEIAKFFMNRNF